MANLIASVVVEEFLKKLISFASQEFGQSWGFEVELQKLQGSLSSLRALLEDAETKQMENRSVTLWLERLKNVAHDADDILDEIATELLRRKMETQIPIKKKVRNLFSPLNPLAFRVKMARKIKDINEKLDGITKDKERFNFREKSASREYREGLQTHSLVHVDDSVIVGRDKDISDVVNMLIASPDKETVSVLSIVGMGGLGKTTLAGLAYNHELVTKLFEKRMWVCVSDDFDVIKLTRKIVESATGTACKLSNLDVMGKIFRDELSGKRFLLVLDDVWNEERTNWINLKTSFTPGAARGSKILVTTRSTNVAEIMGSQPTHHLAGLSEDQCMSIFKHRAFEREAGDEASILMEIGKEIVKKCGGLPLAAKALGSLLSTTRDYHEWVCVRDSEIWNLPRGGNNEIVPALKVSYNHLPSYLKQCFVYCSIFPKDYIIEKDMLIQLWIAEGFISKPLEGNAQMLEDIANDYFNGLLGRSFFQVVKKDEYGDINVCKMHDQDINVCKMHDLIHDLAQSVNGNECLIVQEDKVERERERKTRHLSTFNNGKEQTYRDTLHITNKSSLHTFLVLDDDYKTLPHDILLSFKYLRVLSLKGNKLDKLCPSIGKLKHLRYLDLSYNEDIINIPKSITNLYNLQTLKLIYCFKIRELPTGITKMINLRHLEINQTWIELPEDVGKLTNLQTLPSFTVGKGSRPGIGELGRLLHLRGKLVISGLDNVRNGEEARTAKLKDKQKLRHLKLKWWSAEDVDVDDVMEGLQPPPHLKQLQIDGFPGVKIPSWLMTVMDGRDGGLQQQQQQRLLSSLEVLEISNCKNLLSLSNMRGFPSLKKLDINKCENLTSLPEQEFGNLELLQSLSIKDCPNLTSLPIGIHALTSLQKLTIDRCSALASLPDGIQDLTSLEELSIDECSALTSLPVGIQGLISLKLLKISNCLNLTSLPVDIQSLTLLQDLMISKCSALTSLPEGIQYLTSLKKLNVSECPLTSLPIGIQGLILLQQLTITESPSLTSLPVGIQGLTSLQKLEISNCLNLTSLPVQIQGLTSLRELTIAKCPALTSLPVGIEGLTLLQKLKILDCPYLTSLPDEIQGLTSLQELTVDGCPALTSLPFGIQGLTSLQILRILNWPNLTSLPVEIQGLTSLRELTIDGCPALTSLPVEIQGLTSLQELKIDGCPALTSLPVEIQGLKSLRQLTINGCRDLTSPPDGIQGLTALFGLKISNCPKLTSLPVGIRGLSSLHYMEIEECSALRSLPAGMQGLTSLGRLSILNCPNLTSLPVSIQGLKSLKSMTITGLTALTSLPARMQGLTLLQYLSIENCSNLKSIQGLTSLRQTLIISNCSNLKSIQGLTSLQYLGISNCSNLKSIQGLTSLRELSVSNCSNLTSLPTGIRGLTSLLELRITNCPNLTSLPTRIQGLTSLRRLRISNCPNLTSLPAGIQGLTSLQLLSIRECHVLSERYKKEIGQDWNKIAHIERIHID